MTIMLVKGQTIYIKTNIGRMAIYSNNQNSDKPPIIFLHGVYFDHHLWDIQIREIKDRMVITIDMPLHGESQVITKSNWNLDDCAGMLIEILDSLQIPKVIAIGHSWGSMTILRAAYKQPERFESIGLCNMPFQAASKKQKVTFGLQHSMLMFRNFYTKKAANTLFGKTSLRENPSFINQLKRSMGILSTSQIKQIDKIVILNAEDATDLIKSLKVKAIALKGEEDYVQKPPYIETIVVNGGHISPLEQPNEVSNLVNRLIE